ncbi:hypothetical protein C6N75_06555 [Streptomyces solincola]|uniref:Uncharacterized protein n=1 Tax=Streptomyces solincola TaxID=2100817 RepID=A0A2S9PZZ4_9ACTN|nr:hypothetical protein [Streptomyces solincola]PRH80001.1 hypothetical protein C6N75_06555 [Streptomyces solincola]
MRTTLQSRGCTWEYAGVAGWLLRASTDPRLSQREWAQYGITALPCGTEFAAVRIAAGLVRAAAGVPDSGDADQAVDQYLTRALLSGPVICDRRVGWYYALVPPEAARDWVVEAAVCRGKGGFIGVPQPDARHEHGARCYWAVPMTAPGRLCSTSAVTQLVHTGRLLELARG